MKYKIIGSGNDPVAAIYLRKGEQAKIERGSMVSMRGTSLQANLNSNSGGIGGLIGAVARSAVSGESMLITTATGESDRGCVVIAPSIPGTISALHCGDNQYCLNDRAFLACDLSINYSMVRQKIGRAVFGGTGGFFVMETHGTGDILVNAFGDIIEMNVDDGSSLVIDNQHVVAWDASLKYSIEAASGAFGFLTGEGLVNRFSGTGKVLVQTRSIANLAQACIPYLPTATQKNT